MQTSNHGQNRKQHDIHHEHSPRRNYCKKQNLQTKSITGIITKQITIANQIQTGFTAITSIPLHPESKQGLPQ